MNSDPPTDPAEPPPRRAGFPRVRPARRGSNRSFTLLLAGLLVVLVVIRSVTTHPFPTASHQSPAAAVAGYLTGLEHKDVGQVRHYLAPAQKSQASAVVKAFTSRHAYIAAPALETYSQGSSKATVTFSLQVCSPLQGLKDYSCVPVARAPFGLPDQLTCAKVDGDWYVTTLLKPR
ncbi:MAG: hypothetical protein WA751_07490 [Candidatus Dormiibacterota bacterium]